MPDLLAEKPMVLPRWAPRALLAAWTLAGLAFLLLWRISVSEHRDEARIQRLQAARVARLCGMVLTEIRSVASDVRPGGGAPSLWRRVRVEHVRNKADLLSAFAASCRPASDANAPTLSVDVMIGDLDVLDLEQASREIAVWATWHVEVLSEAERAGWPGRATTTATRTQR